MTKEQEIHLKFALISDNKFFTSEQEFNEAINSYVQTGEFLNSLLKNKEDYSYARAVTYEQYLKWLKEYYIMFHEQHTQLVVNINETVLKFFNDDDKTYSSKEIKKILSDNKIFNLFEGFGGLEHD